MKLSIHRHAAELSLSDTASVLDISDVDSCWTTVHNWMRKADLQPEDDKSPNYVALDETVIQLNNERYWLLAAVKPEPTNFCMSGFIWRVRLWSSSGFSVNSARNTTSLTLCFSSTARRDFRLRSTATTSDFSMLPMEIGTLSDGSSKS